MTRLVSVLLGAFIPPVGVFMMKGLRLSFWINLVLTFFFYLPGCVHAIWVVAHTRRDGRDDPEGMRNFIALLTAWFLPPIGVFLKHGLSVTLLVNCVLTLCFWLPGSIHALWTIVDD